MKKFLHVSWSLLWLAQLSLTFLFAASPELVWHDEFDLPAGSALDSTRWNYDLGRIGQDNNELQTYTNAIENSSIANDHDALDGKSLIVCALKSSDGYTSARLKTQGKFTVIYGRI